MLYHFLQTFRISVDYVSTIVSIAIFWAVFKPLGNKRSQYIQDVSLNTAKQLHNEAVVLLRFGFFTSELLIHETIL